MKQPLNCELHYYQEFIPPAEARELYAELHALVSAMRYQPQLADGSSQQLDFGKLMFLDQELLDSNRFPQEYWGPSLPWTENLSSLRKRIEQNTGQTFRVGVLIFYPDGQSGMDYHADYSAFGDTSTIPSISLGAERLFKLREKENGSEFALTLAHGSLIVMGEHCQERYEHCLPIDPACTSPRISLTFRKYGYDE